MPTDESSLAPNGPAEPALEPAYDAGGLTLRRQVLEIISDVLADSDPQKAWARSQLHDLLAAHPDEPEQALLRHLMTSRDLADDPYVGPLADPAWPGGSASHATLQNQPVFVGQRGEKPIEAALDDRMLLTAFQPIRELTAGHVKGFEALARFVTGERTGTAAWFRGAAAMGLGPDLEIAALHCALFAAREIPAPLFVAFNLSPATCADPRVPALLLDGGVAPDRIVIEITGQVADGELNDLTAAVEPLRRRGLRLAVDGSGAAAASAVQILQLRPDIIKLDRNFLDSVLGSTETADALPAVFELALQTGALLSAEGIESHAELAAVTGLGVATGQGYLLGRPSVDPLDWAAWILQADTPGAQHDL